MSEMLEGIEIPTENFINLIRSTQALMTLERLLALKICKML